MSQQLDACRDDVRALLTNPVRENLRENPYSVYARARELTAMLQISDARWFVTGHAVAVEVLRSASFGSDHRNALEYEQYLDDQGGRNPLQELMMSRVMVFMDPPDHPRVRSLVAKWFTVQAVNRLRGRVTEIANSLIDDVIDRGSMDAVSEYAEVIPLLIVCEVLGVPTEDHVKMGNWSRDLAAVFDAKTSSDTAAKAGEAALNFGMYMLNLINDRRSSPRDDLLSALVAAEGRGELSQEELISTAIFVFRAGQETVQNALSASLVAVANQKVSIRPEAITPDAIEEFLRFEPPVQITARTALVPTVVGGVAIPAGHQLLVAIGAANRDPSVFEEPESLVLARHPNPHLSFTVGSHYCVGASLARLEMDVALTTLFERLPTIVLAGPPCWRETSALRGVDRVPIEWAT